jgi:hypothetical protein
VHITALSACSLCGDRERALGLTALIRAGTSIFGTCVTSVFPGREQQAAAQASSGENREHAAGPTWSGSTVRAGAGQFLTVF